MLTLALISTVALLVWMGFFMMGSLPLIVLKHDTPQDARFIRGLFNVYYAAITTTAAVGALSYGLAGRMGIALAFGCMAGLGLVGRHGIVARMDRLRHTMTADDTAAIRQFRRLHITGMLVNVLLIAVYCVGMVRVSIAERAGGHAGAGWAVHAEGRAAWAPGLPQHVALACLPAAVRMSDLQ